MKYELIKEFGEMMIGEVVCKKTVEFKLFHRIKIDILQGEKHIKTVKHANFDYDETYKFDFEDGKSYRISIDGKIVELNLEGMQ